MKINIIAVGARMPAWVKEGYQEYIKRLPKHFPINLIEIPLRKRNKDTDMRRCIATEASRIIDAIPRDTYLIALDKTGENWSTLDLVKQLQFIQGQGQSLTFIVGGPDGLAESCRQRADKLWSLSALTFPHHLVKIILVEAIYRAWTIIAHHPYHR